MKFLLFTLFFMPALAMANTEYCEKHMVRSTRAETGDEYALIIPGSKIKDAGSWSPNSMTPAPLTAYQAHLLVSDWAVSNLPKFDGIEIRSIELVKYLCFAGLSSTEYWYYVVAYNPILDGNKMYGAKNVVAVLMSGEIIDVKRIEHMEQN
ncbi:hypothetical protein [Neptunicella sp. SCSIO 80796]|uniref:hypothetical protein n=1 Tax=Neptunicella plasticusilytica TaxID=3117012 RepID=UPI003A4DFB05